jgi:hypothetical protein
VSERSDGSLRAAGVAAVLLLAHSGIPGSAQAQLISPGKLAAPHASLEGIRNCTACHELGKGGVANARCLECHEPIARRVAERRGLHASLAARGCAECHEDHFGPAFALVRFDTTGFEHGEETGYELAGGHREVACRECHRPALIAAADVRAYAARHGALERTFLGLESGCEACHAADDPHGEQFVRRRCTACHTEEAWDELANFDHARTRYPLTGLHRDVACERCHRPEPGRAAPFLVYRGLAFTSCASCHRDVHGGAMGAACADCHTTGGWMRVDRPGFEGRFDHDATGFPLVGRHARLTCAGCHASPPRADSAVQIAVRRAARVTSYPRPVAETCLSCHLDPHAGVFGASRGGAVCDNCHGQEGWLPTGYDLSRHNREAAFTLEGAHLATPCPVCHAGAEPGVRALRFRVADTRCEACHAADDPHGAQFDGRPCDACHTVDSYRIPAFDHAATRFPLDGAHRGVPCASCHPDAGGARGGSGRVYRPLGTRCRDCHGGTP